MKRYVNATLTKRFGAFVLDIFTIILGATIVFLTCMELFSKSTLIKEANQIITNIQIQSHLYEYGDDNLTKVVDEKDYEIAIKNYYVDYKKDEQTYHNKMLESQLFNYVDNKYVVKNNVSEDDVKTFYQEMMGAAILEIKNIEDYSRCEDIIINVEYYSLVISIIVAYIVFIILIPILRKKRNTIGQRVINLMLVNSQTNEMASKTQIAFRSLIIFVIEIFVALHCYGLTTLVSVGMIIIRKDHASYHDLLSETKMIDYHYVELDNEINNNGNN